MEKAVWKGFLSPFQIAFFSFHDIRSFHSLLEHSAGILELRRKLFEHQIPLFENLRDILEDQNDIRTFLSLLESHGPILELFQQE